MFESYFVDDQYAPIPLVNFAYGLEQDGTHSMQQARRCGYEAIAQAAGCEVVVIEDRGCDGLDNFHDLQRDSVPFFDRNEPRLLHYRIAYALREILRKSGAT